MSYSFIVRTCLQGCMVLLPACLTAQQTGINFPLPAHSIAQPLTAAEYFIDTDPGYGNGYVFPLPVAAATTITSLASINLNGLNLGVHQFYSRVKDSLGNWGITNRSILYIIDSTFAVPVHDMEGTIVYAEYFIDVDPGFGNALPIQFSAGTSLQLNNISLDISGLSNGNHNVYFRFQDDTGKWSLCNKKTMSIFPVNIQLPQHQPLDSIMAIEYFFDTDPGWGNGNIITVPATILLNNLSFVVDISALGDGIHYLHARTLGAGSLTSIQQCNIGIPLPLILTLFTANLIRDDVHVNWKMDKKMDTAHFEVERSDDGIHFQTLRAGIHTMEGHHFYAIDSGVAKNKRGQLFYRIKVIEPDGGFSYSAVAAVSLAGRKDFATISVLPNPFKNEVMLKWNTDMAQAMDLLLLDISGMLKRKVAVQAKQGLNRFMLPTDDLPSGVYLLYIHGSHGTEMVKIVKQ